MGLLHLVDLVKQRPFFKEPENHATTELQQPWGVSSQFLTPYTTEFIYFIMLTPKEACAYRCYLPFKGNLSLKLMDKLISQCPTGGNSSFCESESAILQVSVHASLKSMHCVHVIRTLLSDWMRCALKLPHQGRTLFIVDGPT